ncbi:uncharacterized protein LOC120842657 [Ixodes scapularis]|uniref:uncharacterized protein LOC120842657 n=1 Tax=Ixodes scapularis TaxID=6945 RepID=UPI001C38B6BF|nr:uncharacterized protein LOC120842657 [Ixodes scapularis]
MNPYQLAQLSCLLSLISSTRGSFQCSNDLLSNPNVLSSLIAVYVCKARVASRYTRASLCPPELQAIFGWMAPATGHSRRMCRILRSEWWQQVRFFRDCLRIACSRQPQQPGTNHRFQDWSRTSIQLTEFLWNQVRPNLPSKKKQRVKEGTVLVLGDRPVAEQHRQILKLGPKFCFEPALKRVDKLALSRLVSRQVPEEDKPRCVAGCVDVLLRSEGLPTRSRSLEPVIDFLATSGLRALVSDKEGFFVIMPEDMFAEKATCAVQKNFKAVLERPAKVKERAVELLERLSLKQVCAGVKREKNLTLEVFFAAKTHKAEIPFRTIVSERGTWLRVVSGYLKKHLDTLNAEDPFVIPSSNAVVSYLSDSNPVGCTAFSIDVEDLYYSMPHDDLMRCVKECITDLNDEVAFRSQCGIPVEGFLEVLSFCLRATFIGWHDKVYVQKSGVCIGSRVAPVLSNIFLAKVDRALDGLLKAPAKKIFRYVDDYLVFVDKGNFSRTLDFALKTFKEQGLGLRFTFETPKDQTIQFLDLSVDVSQSHVCWWHHPRTTKNLLDFRSGHSKLVKISNYVKDNVVTTRPVLHIIKPLLQSDVFIP